MCLNCALYCKAMKKWRETKGHMLDIGMEHGLEEVQEERREEFAVTDDNACTIDWVKQSHVLRHFSYCFLVSV